MTPENLSNILNITWERLLHVAVVVAAGWAAIAIVKRVLPRLAERLPGRQQQQVLGSVQVLRLLIIFLVIFLSVPLLIDPTFKNLFAVLGALGLALGFALKDYASSLAAGMVAVYEIPYRLGDWVEIDGRYGKVTAISLRAIEILTPDDTRVIIPHAKIWTGLVANSNSGTQYLQCVADFYLHPRHDPAAVQSALHDVALTSPYVQLKQPVVVVAQEQPWGTHYRLRAYPVDPRDQFQFITDLCGRGKTTLMALGVEFAAVMAVPPPS
ncbi:MAG: mechanosensitive ion channel domain-containing protein [Desulfobacterales bacterium]